MSRCTCVCKGSYYIDQKGRAWIADPCIIPTYLPPSSPRYDDLRDVTSQSVKRKSSLKKPKKVRFDDHPHRQSERESQSGQHAIFVDSGRASEVRGRRPKAAVSDTGHTRSYLEVDLDLEHLAQVLSLDAKNATLYTNNAWDQGRTVPPRYPSQSFARNGCSFSTKPFPTKASRQRSPSSSSSSSIPSTQSRHYWEANRGYGVASEQGRYESQSDVTRGSEHTIWLEQTAGVPRYDADDTVSNSHRDGKQTTTATARKQKRRQLKSNHEKWLRYFAS